MKDFSLDIYRELLESLQQKGYQLIPFEQYCKKKGMEEKYVILRHDVDAKPENSLKVAQIEHSIGAKATYYFRVGKESNRPDAIRAIVQLGHEIGYHYEDLALCHGNFELAYEHFQTWLEYFRYYYAVETICMHGAPTSKYDGRKLWQQYDYRPFGIIGEPYLDTDFNQVLYLTDTGRCWDGYNVAVRDKIPQYQDEWKQKGWEFHTSTQLLQAINEDRLPRHIMLTTHPQRWTNNQLDWWLELIKQSIKNIIKKILIRIR